MFAWTNNRTFHEKWWNVGSRLIKRDVTAGVQFSTIFVVNLYCCLWKLWTYLACSIHRFANFARKTPLHQPAKATTHIATINTSALLALWLTLTNTKVYKFGKLAIAKWNTFFLIGSDSQRWSTEQAMQMYCSDVGWWLWQADAMESYTQGPQTGKCCKLKVQKFYYCCLVYWNMLYTRWVTYGQSFLIFP